MLKSTNHNPEHTLRCDCSAKQLFMVYLHHYMDSIKFVIQIIRNLFVRFLQLFPLPHLLPKLTWLPVFTHLCVDVKITEIQYDLFCQKQWKQKFKY